MTKRLVSRSVSLLISALITWAVLALLMFALDWLTG